MTPAQALIDAIEDFRLRPNHAGKHEFTNIHETLGDHPSFTCRICDALYDARTARLDAAIVAAKAAEDGVETKWMIERKGGEVKGDSYKVTIGSDEATARRALNVVRRQANGAGSGHLLENTSQLRTLNDFGQDRNRGI